MTAQRAVDAEQPVLGQAAAVDLRGRHTYRVTMKIGRAGLHDLAEVRSLLASRDWDEEFEPGRGSIYIARDPDLVGCLQFVDVGDGDGVLDIVVVEESARRKGIGTALVRAVMADYPQHLYVSCRQDAVPFYETLGFLILRGNIDSSPTAVKEFWSRAGNRAPLAMVNNRE